MSEKENTFVDKEQQSVKKTWKGEKAKLAQMTAGKRAEYIWSYYKIHILVVIALMALVIGIIYNRITYTVPKLYGIEVNSNVINDQFEKEVEKYVGMGKHESCTFIPGLNGDLDAPAVTAYNQIDIYTMASTIDFAFTDEAGAKYMCSRGALVSVEDQLPAELLNLWTARVVEMSVWDANTEDTYFDAPVAIDISGTALQKYLQLPDEICYFMICDMSGNHEYMESLYQMFYEIETGSYSAK